MATTSNSLWHPDLAVGSRSLDRRNRDVFNQLAAAEGMIASLDALQLARWLRTLFTQFESLLAEEEAELAEIAYPELAFHRTLHEQARSLIRNARLQLLRCEDNDPPATLTRDTCAALSVWLMRHVIDVDKLFFPYIDARFRVS